MSPCNVGTLAIWVTSAAILWWGMKVLYGPLPDTKTGMFIFNGARVLGIAVLVILGFYTCSSP